MLLLRDTPRLQKHGAPRAVRSARRDQSPSPSGPDRLHPGICPPRAPPRERWLTRDEAARLIRAAWRYREAQKGVKTERASRQHVTRFILVALHTGTRSEAICGAALDPAIGRGFVDLEKGLFHRRALGAAEEAPAGDPNLRSLASARAPLEREGAFARRRGRVRPRAGQRRARHLRMRRRTPASMT